MSQYGHYLKSACRMACGAVVLAALLTGGCGISKPLHYSVVLHDAPELKFPVPTDSSCPAHWDGDTFYIFSSLFQAQRLSGPSLFELGNAAPVTWDRGQELTRWIEATYKDEDGTLYGWYHHEPLVCSQRMPKILVAPIIGAAVSHDNGLTWTDLGFIIQDDPSTYNCQTLNFYFAGGSGDFCVNVDRQKKYIYFTFNTYDGRLERQGVCVARMKYEDRKAPMGKVWKWHESDWRQPGVFGITTPVFETVKDWHSPAPDAFWGASIHYNTYLESYVMLLNRAIDPNWLQEGTYISFNADLADCRSWSEPEKLKDDGSWYPLVIGTDKYQTDKLAGRKARYFEQGVSKWEIEFIKE